MQRHLPKIWKVFLDGVKINLLSLKTGTVKQFGQESGGEFDKLNNLFRHNHKASL